MNKNVNLLKKLFGLALTVGVAGVLRAQQNTNILSTMRTEVDTAKADAVAIVAIICWIFMAVGILGIIYCAVTDSQRMKLSIITFVGAGLALTIGYATGIL